MFKSEQLRVDALRKCLPSNVKFHPFTSFDHYVEIEKCIHDLTVQQRYLTQNHKVGFVWIRRIVYTVDLKTGERYYYNNDVDMLCSMSDNHTFQVDYFVPGLPCSKFPKQLDVNVYEYALAKLIKLKYPYLLKNTKVGYFLDRSLNRVAGRVAFFF